MTSPATQPKITMGMTCFNAAATIGDAIDSALTQDWENKELIIVNDCSADNSNEIILEKIKNVPYARLITHEKNTGFAGSLNTLIRNATGEFLAIFDDDDVSVPHRLTAQYQRIIDHEKLHNDDKIVCHAARVQKFPNGLVKYVEPIGCKIGEEPTGEPVARRTLVGQISKGVLGVCANCSRMARLKVFREMGGFDGEMRRVEDTDFNVRFGLNGGTFLGIAEPLVYQTMTSDSDKNLDAELTAQIQMYKKHMPYLQSIGWDKFSILWIDARFANLNRQYFKLMGVLVKAFFMNPVKCIQKLIWAIPAHESRRDLKTFYKEEFK